MKTVFIAIISVLLALTDLAASDECPTLVRALVAKLPELTNPNEKLPDGLTVAIRLADLLKDYPNDSSPLAKMLSWYRENGEELRTIRHSIFGLIADDFFREFPYPYLSLLRSNEAWESATKDEQVEVIKKLRDFISLHPAMGADFTSDGNKILELPTEKYREAQILWREMEDKERSLFTWAQLLADISSALSETGLPINLQAEALLPPSPQTTTDLVQIIKRRAPPKTRKIQYIPPEVLRRLRAINESTGGAFGSSAPPWLFNLAIFSVSAPAKALALFNSLIFLGVAPPLLVQFLLPEVSADIKIFISGFITLSSPHGVLFLGEKMQRFLQKYISPMTPEELSFFTSIKRMAPGTTLSESYAQNLFRAVKNPVAVLEILFFMKKRGIRIEGGHADPERYLKFLEEHALDLVKASTI